MKIKNPIKVRRESMIRKKKIVGLLLGTSLLLGTAFTSFAGSLTFSHGNYPANLQVGGKMSSTTNESLMRIDTNVRFSSTGSGTQYRGSDYKNKKSAQNLVSVGNTKGQSFCYYYVNGKEKHRSTAWYSFNY